MLRSNEELGLGANLSTSIIVFLTVACLAANEVVIGLFRDVDIDTFNVSFILVFLYLLMLFFLDFIHNEPAKLTSVGNNNRGGHCTRLSVSMRGFCLFPRIWLDVFANWYLSCPYRSHRNFFTYHCIEKTLRTLTPVVVPTSYLFWLYWL